MQYPKMLYSLFSHLNNKTHNNKLHPQTYHPTNESLTTPQHPNIKHSNPNTIIHKTIIIL